MKVILILILIAIVSCGAKRTQLRYGGTSESELIVLKGTPIKEEILEDGKILIYPENEKHQIKEGRLLASYYGPAAEHEILLYWQHRFKDCNTSIRKIPGTLGQHTPPEYEFTCPAEGITVVYREDSDKISRVIEHEKK